MGTTMMPGLGKAERLMVFDWDKAARVIRKMRPTWAEAGLSGDWDYTGGVIYSGGEIREDVYTYLASRWAIPMLKLYLTDDRGEDPVYIECYIFSDETEWNENTKWPESSLSILKD